MVDDNKANLAVGKAILDDFYDVYALPSAEKLFQFLTHVTPDLILLDIEMPGMDGFEALTILKGDKQHMDIPVIFVTAKSSEEDEYDGLALGAIDYVTKPFSATLLLKRIENHLLIEQQKAKLQDYSDNLLKMVQKKTQQVFGLQNAIISTVAEMLEFRDNETGWHVHRTQSYMKMLIERMIEDGIYADELLTWDLDIVLPASQLHDVGKIAISDTILNKPGKLTPEEFEIMKTHTTKGVEAIARMEEYGYFGDFLEYAKTIAGTHHEKWDGSGYPYGYKGKDIPLEGRIMAIADVYDALISNRSYKKAFTAKKSNEIIIEGSGTHFDPAIVGAFKHLTSEFEQISKEYNDDLIGKIAVPVETE
jgi:putative two-component system response regulator